MSTVADLLQISQLFIEKITNIAKIFCSVCSEMRFQAFSLIMNQLHTLSILLLCRSTNIWQHSWMAPRLI